MTHIPKSMRATQCQQWSQPQKNNHQSFQGLCKNARLGFHKADSKEFPACTDLPILEGNSESCVWATESQPQILKPGSPRLSASPPPSSSRKAPDPASPTEKTCCENLTCSLCCLFTSLQIPEIPLRKSKPGLNLTEP